MKILPFPDTPIFLCYHNRAFPFGVVQANSSMDITKWVCTKGINCGFYSESPANKFSFAVSDLWSVGEHLMSQQILQIQKDYLNLFGIDLLQILKTAIDNDCYIHGGYNEKYIPGKWAYSREDHMHDFLIIGYDDKNFTSVGYLEDGSFKRFTIPISNLMDALIETTDGRTNINLFRYKTGAIPSPNIKRMVEDLKKYISTASYFENPISKVNLYGIAACIRLKEFFVDEVIQSHSYIDKRYSLAFCEHKWILAQLIDLFLDKNEKKKYQELSNQNLERARKVHMLGLKMRCSGNMILINRIEALMDEIASKEIEYIPPLIELLQEKYPTV